MIYSILVLLFKLFLSYIGFLFAVFIYVHSKMIFSLILGDNTAVKSSYFFCRPSHFYDRGTAVLVPFLIAVFSRSMAIGFFLHPPVNVKKIKFQRLFKVLYPFAGTIGVFTVILFLLTIHTFFQPTMPFFETIKYPLDYFLLSCILTCLFQLFPIYGTDLTLLLGNFFKEKSWYQSLVNRTYLFGTMPLIILIFIQHYTRMTIINIYTKLEIIALNIVDLI